MAGMLVVLGTAACLATPPPVRPGPDTAALIEQAEVAEKERRYDRARALYLEAKAAAPDDHSRALAARTYGRALIFWGEYQRAGTELDEAVRLEPGDPGAWHDLAMLRHGQGDMPGAEAAFRRSIAAAPDDGRSRIALAALLWEHGRLGEALSEYQALSELDLPPRVRDKVAWAIRTLRQRLDAAAQ